VGVKVRMGKGRGPKKEWDNRQKPWTIKKKQQGSPVTANVGGGGKIKRRKLEKGKMKKGNKKWSVTEHPRNNGNGS